MGLPIAQAMVLFALVVGLAAGLAAFAFYGLTEAAVHQFLRLHHAAPSHMSRAILVLSPALGGLMTGLLLQRMAPDAKGGVADVIDALLHRDGFIRGRVGLVKALASAICIGSGGSAGREGPVVQIGASVGSALAQVFGVTRQRAQLLVACGAAAGIAAVFNAPIAGAFFVAEVVTGSFLMRDLVLLFTASAAGAVVARSLLWDHAVFAVPPLQGHGASELWLLVILGPLTALAAHLFILLMHRVEQVMHGPRFPEVLRPAIGGLAVGLLAVLLGRTEIFGTGGPFMEWVFSGKFFTGRGFEETAALLLTLLFAKMLATSFTLGSGGAGGDLMPSLFIGGSLGGLFGMAAHSVVPGISIPPASYALVGAVAFFAGVAHAPITGVVLGIEIGWDYGLAIPLLLACSSSALVSSWLRTSSIYTLKLELRGIDVHQARMRAPAPVDPLDHIRVADVMTRDVPVVSPDMTLNDLLTAFASSGHHGYVVAREDMLLGVVSLSDTQRALERGASDLTVSGIMTPAEELVVCRPHESLRDVMARSGHREVGRVPVIEPGVPDRVVGVLRRTDILRGLAMAAAKPPGDAELLAGGRLEGVDLLPGHPWIGLRVKDLSVPAGVVFVNLRRGHRVDAPRGDTRLRVGDHLTAWIDSEAETSYRDWLPNNDSEAVDS